MTPLHDLYRATQNFEMWINKDAKALEKYADSMYNEKDINKIIDIINTLTRLEQNVSSYKKRMEREAEYLEN